MTEATDQRAGAAEMTGASVIESEGRVTITQRQDLAATRKTIQDGGSLNVHREGIAVTRAAKILSEVMTLTALLWHAINTSSHEASHHHRSRVKAVNTFHHHQCTHMKMVLNIDKRQFHQA